MPANFLQLPLELHNKIYKLCLSRQELMDPWAKDFRRPCLTLGLLLANQTIHQEASFLLYSQNLFNFTMATLENIASFLKDIGHNNAGNIRQVYINFPTYLSLSPGDIALEDDSIAILRTIQGSCTKLRTLTISPHNTYAIELRLKALNDPTIVVEALKLVDTYFRAITSLRDIFIEIYRECPSGDTRKEMERLKWTVSRSATNTPHLGYNTTTFGVLQAIEPLTEGWATWEELSDIYWEWYDIQKDYEKDKATEYTLREA